MSSRLLQLITPGGTPQLLGSHALCQGLIAFLTKNLPMAEAGDFHCYSHVFENWSIPSDHAAVRLVIQKTSNRGQPVSFMALCKLPRMLSTFEMTDVHGPDRLSRMIVSFHPVLFWMFFVIGSPAMLPKNSHTNPSPYVPCTRQTLMLIPVKSAWSNART